MTAQDENAAKEEMRLYALRAVTEDWREASKLSNDEKLPTETRAFYKRTASEFHDEMIRLGHKH